MDVERAVRTELGKHAENLLDRVRVALEMHVVVTFEDAHRPVRPVQLVDVDVVGLQASQTAFDRLQDLGATLAPGTAILA